MEESSWDSFHDDVYQDRHSVKTIPREIVATEARKIVRTEMLGNLEKRKNDKVLQREIDKFKMRLHLDRTFNVFHEDSSNIKASTDTKGRLDDIHDLSERKITSLMSLANARQKNSPNLLQISKSVNQKTRRADSSHKQENVNVEKKTGNERQEQQKVTYLVSERKEKLHKEDNCLVTLREKTIEKKSTSVNKKLIEKILIHRILKYYFMRWKLFVSSMNYKRNQEKIWREKINTFMKRCNERVAVVHEKKAIACVPQPNTLKKSKRNDRNYDHAASDVISNTQNNDYEDIKKKQSYSNQNIHQVAHQINAKLDPSLKCKAKLLRQFSSDHPKREKTQLYFPEPEIVQDMDRKHTERKQRLNKLREKKQRTEEEKDRLAKERYERQIHEAEMEKKQKLREFQKKLRMERMQQERKRAEWQRMKELEDKATNHYNSRLVTKLGWDPWRELVFLRKDQSFKAFEHDSRRTCRWAFLKWVVHLEQVENERVVKAMGHYSQVMLKECFRMWRGAVRKRHIQMQVAEDWYDYLLIRNTFESWQGYCIDKQMERRDKWEKAVLYYKTKLMCNCIKYWMLLPQVNRLERAKELRKNEWRGKVQQVLPDFRPYIYAECI